jgi:hypothetical protein
MANRFSETIILHVVLYGSGTQYLTLMEEHKLQMFGTKELRTIYDPTEDEVSWATAGIT